MDLATNNNVQAKAFFEMFEDRQCVKNLTVSDQDGRQLCFNASFVMNVSSHEGGSLGLAIFKIMQVAKFNDTYITSAKSSKDLHTGIGPFVLINYSTNNIQLGSQGSINFEGCDQVFNIINVSEPVMDIGVREL